MHEPFVVFDLTAATDWTELRATAASLPRTAIAIGWSEAPLPHTALPALQELTLTLAPKGPGRVSVPGTQEDLRTIEKAVMTCPGAAATLASVLRAGANLDVADALVVESLGYSMLLAGPEFRNWRRRTPFGTPSPDDDAAVLLERRDGCLDITLNRPGRHNAFGHRVRDLALEALTLVQLDPSLTEVVISGAGRSFCSGGDLDEFGTAPDIVTAHRIRIEQSVGAAIHGLRNRVRFVVHGACIGAGIELSAFAARIEAREDAYFALPEVGLGLIPGAGGTVSVPRRIGRWRTAYLALTGNRIDAATALDWGLVDALL